MNIQQFQYILAVAEFKHFEKAAESCFVTQSTLSTMINRFEDEVGVQVFNRKTKPVSVTKEGVEIIDRLRIINKEIDALGNLIQELKGEMMGELHIGIIPTVASCLLPLFLSRFANLFPKVKMVVQEMTTSEIQKALKNRTIDIGILAVPLVDSNLFELELYHEPFLLYDWSESKRKTKVTIDELDYSKLWLLEEGHCLRTQIQSICDLSHTSDEMNVNIEFKAGSLDSLMRFTKSNNGMTILPYLATIDLTEIEQEKITPFAYPVPVRSVGIVTHRHFVKKKLLHQLQKVIREAVIPLLPSHTEVSVLKPL